MNRIAIVFILTFCLPTLLAYSQCASPAPTVTPGSRCGTGTVTLSASRTAAGVFRWYAALTGGTALRTSGSVTNDNYTTASISATTTYYVTFHNGTCESTPRTAIVATVNAVPATPTGTAGSRCGAGTVTLSASSATAGTFVWYSASTGGTVLRTSSAGLTADSYTTASITATTNYFVSVRNAANCEGARRSVAATINAVPAAPTVTAGSTCGPGIVTLAVNSATAGTFKWYDAATAGNVVQTSATGLTTNNFTTPSLSATTTYYVTITNSVNCESTPRKAVTATVNTAAVAPTPTGGSRCGTGTVALSATSTTAGSFKWYAALTGGTALRTSASVTSDNYTTASISATTTYYVTFHNGTCESTPRTAIVATVNAVPATPIGTAGSRCGAGTVTLSASSATAGTFVWYSASTGGTVLRTSSAGLTADSYTTASITATTNYFVSVRSAANCEGARRSVAATINVVPAAPTVTAGSTCGPGIVTLAANSATAGTFKWYDAATAGNVVQTSATGLTTNNFTTPSLSVTTTYYVTLTNSVNCESATRTAITATVNANSPAVQPTVTNRSRCGTGTVQLTATSATSGTFRWYNALTGGTLLRTSGAATTDNYTTPSISATTVYYVTFNNGTCESTPRRAVTATINPAAVAPVATAGSRCSTGTVALSATSTTAGTFKWYAALTGGTALRTSPAAQTTDSYTTPSISATTTYYVTFTNASNCESTPRTAVSATVNAFPAAPTATGASRCDVGTVTLSASSATAGTFLWYAAATGGTALQTSAAGLTTNSFTTPSLSASVTYYVTINNGLCESTPRTAVAATINPIPATFEVTGGGMYTPTVQATVNLTGSAVGTSYQLLLNGANSGVAINGTGSDLSWSVSTAGTYTVVTTGACSAAMSGSAKVQDQQSFALDALSFQYKYDGRRRMTHKKVPGAEWVYMVYDQRDRLVMTQDGEQRKTNKWTFTKYDPLNRPVVTGLYNTGTTVVDQPTMQANVDTYYNQVASPSWAWFETFSTSGSLHGYDNKSYPNTNLDLLTVTYYDNYDFKTLYGSGYDYASDNLSATPLTNVTYTQPDEANNAVIGQVTGTKVKILDGGFLGGLTWLKSVNYYDDKYRLIQTLGDHIRKGVQRTTNLVDFTGKILASKTSLLERNVIWENLVNVKINGTELKKTISTYGADAGGASQQILPANQNGWVEMVYPGSNGSGSEQYFGLNDSNPDAGAGNIDYALLITANNVSGNVRVYENGVLKAAIGGLVQQGAVLRIERVGTQIQYKVNGVISYESTIPSTTQLLVDVSILQGYGFTCLTQTSIGERLRTIARTFDYDHAGRLLKTWHSINGTAPVLLAQNEYNELGQLVAKNLHNTDPASTPDANRQYKQTVDYRYNIRGWLTKVNDATTPTPGDFFSMDLNYNNPTASGGAAQYNGNISETLWRGSDGRMQSYGYAYDPMNRLTEAKYYNQAMPLKNGRFDEKIWDVANNTSGYDLNGNIRFLTRAGRTGATVAGVTTYGSMDNLSYTYRGNQLLKVDDSAIKTEGFREGATTGNDYSYDANGNMTLDRNKDISIAGAGGAILYNHLNLPEQVTKSNGDYVKYIYDATGRKLRQEVYLAGQPAPKKKSEYAGEYMYENDTLKFINHEEGRVVTQAAASQPSFTLQYPLNGNMVDTSDKALNGTLQGGYTLATDRKGNQAAVQFNGNDGFGSIPNSPDLDFKDGDFSVSFWVKKLQSTVGWSNPSGVGKWNTGGSPGTNSWSLGLAKDANSDVPGFAVEIGNTYYMATATTSLVLGQWYHLVGTKEKGMLKIYVNGVLEGSLQLPGTNFKVNQTPLPIYVGRVGGGAYTNAVYDDIQINNGFTPEYQYHLKDHLGNVRLTFTTKDETDINTATMETANEPTEQGQFLNYSEAIKINATIFDRTHRTPDGLSNTTFYSTRLTGGTTNAINGLAKSLSVMPGDKVDVEVFAKYLDPNSNNWSAALATFMASIAAGGGAPAGTIIDGNLPGSLGNNVFPYPGHLERIGDSGTGPKAYLNYLFFDKDYVSKTGGFKRLTTAAIEQGTDVTHERLFFDNNEINITEAGYLYIWLSNENDTPIEVYFDDFKVTHTKSPVVQSDDYYPFGLTFNSYIRENSVAQDFKYNGKEEQTDLGIGWLDYGARMYDNTLGRFFNHDRFAQKYFDHSPYHYAFNNPILNIDVNGDSVVIGKVLTGVTLDGKAYHLNVIHVDEKTGKEKVIAEAFPQNEVSEPADLLNGGFGNLEKSREDNRTDPASISQEDKEKIPLPEGLSETEFVNKITESVNSYDNSADYDMLPDETGEGVNSNSFVGSVLRKSGSNFTPSVNAPGFGKDIFSQPKASTETLTQKIENAVKSIIDRIKK